MKKIMLTKNRYALIDDMDLRMVNWHRWYASNGLKNYHVFTKTKDALGDPAAIPMHRFILDAKPGQEVTHLNGNRWDNRRNNLVLDGVQQKTLETGATPMEKEFSRPWDWGNFKF